MYLGDHKYVIRHSWRPHTLRGGVELTTTLLDSKGRSANTKTVYTDKTYLALSSKGEEMAEVVLKNKRYWWNRQQVRQPRGRSSSSKKRRTADSDIFCPIITALRGGRVTRSRRATADKPIEQEVRCNNNIDVVVIVVVAAVVVVVEMIPLLYRWLVHFAYHLNSSTFYSSDFAAQQYIYSIIQLQCGTPAKATSIRVPSQQRYLYKQDL